MAVSLSSSSTITSIALQLKLKTIHRLEAVSPGYSNSQFRKSLSSVSLRRRAVVVSAITGASGAGFEKDTADLLDTAKILDLRGNEIPISDLWKDRKAAVAFARHFGCVLCRMRAAYLAEEILEACCALRNLQK